jgi:hypothetical protein
MAANASPEPFSNIFLSLGEDIFTIGMAALVAFHPVVILVAILIFIVLLIWLGPKVYRSIRRMFRQAGEFLGGARRPGTAA